MKKFIFVVFMILICQSAFSAPVRLRITQTAGKSGKVLIAIYDEAAAFPDVPTRAIIKKLIPVTASQVEVTTTVDLPVGDYAVAIFLDENGDEKLNTNILGIPKERFGFSNNSRILTGPPSFGEAAIEVKDGQNDFILKLIKLF